YFRRVNKESQYISWRSIRALTGSPFSSRYRATSSGPAAAWNSDGHWTTSIRAESSPKRLRSASANRSHGKVRLKPDTTQETIALEGDSRDCSEILVGVHGADKQDRQHLLGGRSDRPDAIRVRPRGGRTQGRTRGSRAVSRPGRTGEPAGRRQQVAPAEARGRDQGVSESRGPHDGGEVRAGASESEERARRQ